MDPAVSVIVPARDAGGTLAATLDALLAQQVPFAYEVIVVDNGSGDDSADIAEAHPLRPTVLRRPRGDGPGAARNAGVATARAGLIAFTDADCLPEPRWLATGVAALEGADIVQGRVVPVPGPRGPFDRTLTVASEYGLYETANLFVHRGVFDRAGAFEDWADAERPFGEDVVFAWRARRAGAGTAFAEDAVVRHAVVPGSITSHLAERRREVHFPALVRQVPELRDAFCFERWFLSPRCAAFDLAALSMLVARLRRSRSPLVLAVPWLVLAARETRSRAGRLDGRVLAAVAAGDAIGCAALLEGTVRARTPLF